MKVKKMVPKTIKKVLRYKLDQLVSYIAETDKELADQVNENSLITGGAIVSLLLGEKVNDFDIYFRDIKTAQDVFDFFIKKMPGIDSITAVSQYDHTNKLGQLQLYNHGRRFSEIISEKKNLDINIQEDGDINIVDDAQQSILKELIKETENTEKDKDKYRPVFITNNSISLAKDFQIITRFIGEPEAIHMCFDYVHCTCYWLSDTNELVLPQNALESILTKTLYYKGGSLYPLCSIFRSRKFIKRGWKINAGQYLKMALDLNELNLKDIETLRDQLIGVDTLYFLSFLDALEKGIASGKVVDSTYIFNLIDQIF